MRTRSATSSKLYLDILFQALSRHNIDKQTFISFCENSAHKADTSRTRLSVTDAIHYWSKAAELTKCKTLGLEAGQHVHPSDYGIMSHVWMNCENLMEGAQLTIRYKHLMNSAFQAELSPIRNNKVAYKLNFSDVPTQVGSAFIELDFASILYLGQFLCDRQYKHQVSLAEVHFKHSPNAQLSHYESVFGCPVKFQQKQNQIICQKEVLELPVHAPNKDLRKKMIKMVDRITAIELGSPRFSGQVTTLIKKELKNGLPDSDAVAKSLGCSVSTLKRNLQSENTSFQSLCNQVRKEKAGQLLALPESNISEIAFGLGFANVSAFHRAFKRWFDMTPAQYRATHTKH